VLNNNSESFTF